MSTDGDPATGQRNVDFVWLFLKLGGRVSRKAYALAAALMVVVQVFVFYRIGLAEEGSPEFGMWMFGFMLVFPLIMWASFALSVKRLHDIGKSTKIVDRQTGKIHMGEVPPYSVVVSGSLPGKNLPGENYGPSLYCAVIVKTVDEKTRSKTGINELLRD